MKHIPASAFRTASYPLGTGAAPGADAQAFDRLDLFGLPMTSSEPRHIAAHIVELAGTGQRLTINFVNAHCVNVAHRDASYRRALRVSDMLLPDGIGIELAARMSGAIRPENLNGTDLFPLICERAAVEGTGLFLLGGMPGVADGAAAWACGQYNALFARRSHPARRSRPIPREGTRTRTIAFLQSRDGAAEQRTAHRSRDGRKRPR